ncbi:MAG: long-chain acyl-CoA synthetase [Arenicella sp.]|jgi:long-chain acyl-CoA synthetase
MTFPTPLVIRLKGVEALDKIAITDNYDSLSYQQLIDKVESLSQWLCSNDVATLALHAQNSIDWVVVDLACQEAGIRCIPLPDFFSDEQLENCLKDTLVDLLMTNSTALINKAHNNHILAREVVDVPCSIRALKLAPKIRHEDFSVKDQRCPSHTQKITFTSGSTGAPKGVCLTANHQWLTAEALATTIDLNSPKHLCLLPLATLLENVAGIYAPLLSGGTIVVPSDKERGLSGSSGLELRKLLECITNVAPATLILLPQLLAALVAACQQGWTPPNTLKFIAVGGAKVAPELLNQALSLGLPVYEGYGLSECGSVVALNTPSNSRPGKVGKLLPHCSLAVVDEEIIVSNPIFQGYYDDRESWYPDLVYTGDLGLLEDGYLIVNGRKKNIIISSFGRNINPEWVESELLGQPLLQQCVVVGENRPNLAAFISAPQGVTDQQLQKWILKVNARLPDYAQVQAWERLDLADWNGLLTANGRPQRQKLNQKFAQRIDALYSYPNFYQSAKPETNPSANLTLVSTPHMTFFERINNETLQARNYLLASPIMQRAMTGDISKHDYGAFLLQAYHHVKHTTPLLMSAGSRMPGSKEWLREALAEYIEEELGHQEWILNDLEKCGYGKEIARASTPNSSTELMVAYAYDMINRVNPVGFFGMVHVLEGTSVTMADNAAQSIQDALGLPNAAFSYLRSHGAIDIEHIKFFEELMNRIDDPDDQAQIIHCANMFYHLYASIFRELDESQVLSIAA